MKTTRLSISILVLAVLTAFAMPLQAQTKQERETIAKNRKEMGEKIKASKIAYITQHMNLSPEEAEKFWPIYNEQEQKREEITHSIMERFKGPKEDVELSDKEAEDIIQERFAQEQALLDLKMEYHTRYLDILPASRVLKLYEVENNFRRGLMEKLGRREGGKKPEGRGTAPPNRGECAGNYSSLQSTEKLRFDNEVDEKL